MKNKTIERNTIMVLAEDECVLPKGTDCKKYINGKLSSSWKCGDNLRIYGDHAIVYEVDFSDLPPLYPTKGMEVPEEGIEFAKITGSILLDVGVNGFTYMTTSCNKYFRLWSESINSDFELTRTLPKTKTVCAECHKEVCECKHEEGWYRVKIRDEWRLMYWNSRRFETSLNSCVYYMADSISKVDWANPINVTLEQEQANEL